MVTAVAPRTEDTESALIARALSALSRCNWEVGECAALWTKRFARGRTDADFASLVGLSPDQVYQRRRVWETFGDVSGNYPQLKWSHFYAALNWDDAAECLQWAQDVQAGVAEMRAWRRAQHGEDLSETSPDESMGFGPVELTVTSEAVPFDGGTTRKAMTAGGPSATEGGQTAALAAGGAEPNAGVEYAPFREDAATPAPRETERQEPTTEQLVKRMTSAVERCHGAMNSQFEKQFHKLPEKLRKRFLKAVEQLAEKAATLEG
jgi:hypothetical protein